MQQWRPTQPPPPSAAGSEVHTAGSAPQPSRQHAPVPQWPGQSPDALPQLLATLRCFSKDSTVVLIEHSDRGVWEGQVYGYPPELKNFFRAVEADGLWQPSVVRDVGRHITLRMVRRK